MENEWRMSTCGGPREVEENMEGGVLRSTPKSPFYLFH